MTKGFEKQKIGLEVKIYEDELDSLIKKYKKAKKYMKSSLYQIKTMDGNEEYISKLIKEAEEDPL
jgi:uncharacterized protein involved in tolerance to divalent cations